MHVKAHQSVVIDDHGADELTSDHRCDIVGRSHGFDQKDRAGDKERAQQPTDPGPPRSGSELCHFGEGGSGHDTHNDHGEGTNQEVKDAPVKP